MEENERKSSRSLVRGILSGLLLVYLVFAILISNHLYANEKVSTIKVSIDTIGHQNYIRQEVILSELPWVPDTSFMLSSINLSKMEQLFRELDNVEEANVYRSVKGNINIDIVPMIPVARVFATDGTSYYINKDGKKLRANRKYHVDVPIVSGHVDDSIISAVDLLPLMQFVAADSLWNSYTSAFKVDNNHDVILIPIIKGHVVNLGDPRDKNIENKFQRLRTIYREVIPYKGWNYYDTISVKYAGQAVATKRAKQAPVPDLLYELEDSEEVSIENMSIN